MENGYFGGEAMMGEKGLDIRNLASGMKAKEKVFQKGMAKRKKWGGISDFFEMVVGKIPGYGQFLQPMLDVFSEQQMQKRIGVEGGPDLRELETMWTGGEGTSSQEEWEKIYGASDVSLWEGLMRGAGDVISSDEGSEFIFGREGGRVPKYKKGGGIFKRFGKKDKVPERDEALMALDAILSGGYERKEGKHEYPMGYTVSADVDYEDGVNLERIISKLSTPGGDRYYPGEGKSRSSSLASTKAMMDAASRAYHSPADSITTDQLAKFRELGLFEQGGQVPKYYGGGSVSGSPTIAGYFSQQGKTLGGSDKQSVAEKLGMK